MSRALRALIRLELGQAGWASIMALILMTLHVYGSVTSTALDGVPSLSPNTLWFFSLLMLAVTVAYRQTNREGRGDMWAFAMHRPASGVQIFGAKVIVGMGGFLVAMFIAIGSTMWWTAVPRRYAGPLDHAFWMPPFVDCLAVLTFYAAGLYAGVSRERIGGRWIGLILAFTSWIAALATRSFAAAVIISIGFTALVAAGALARFTKPDFRAQPRWGHATNLVGAFAAVAMVSMIAWAVLGWAMRDRNPIPQRVSLPAWPYSTITRDGRLELVSRADYNGPTDHDVISSSQIPIDRRSVDPVIHRSYRDARAWVTPLFTALEGPDWYYERRVGLISIRDPKTKALIGWLGPDGYSKGAAMPAARFSGSVQTNGLQNSRRTGLLILSTSVYALDDLTRPVLLFKAPEGETLIGAAEGHLYSGVVPRADAPWGWFNVFTTETHTYVADRAGTVQLEVANPRADSNRVVNVYRAPYGPGAPTFVWFRPQQVSVTDSLNEVLEFRVGQGKVGERRFATTPNVIPVYADDGAPRTMSLSGSVPLVPVAQVYGLTRPMSPVARRNAAPSVLISVLVCLGLAALVFSNCSRRGFSSRATLAWTALTALLGPITLVVMWFFVEWPPKRLSARPVAVGLLLMVGASSLFGADAAAARNRHGDGNIRLNTLSPNAVRNPDRMVFRIM